MTAPGPSPPRARHDPLPAAGLLLGLVVVFAGLLTAPPGISGDAARLGLQALDFLRRGVWPFYIYHLYAPNPLMVYLQAPAFLLFGFNLATLRGVSAFFGALAVPAAYIACREVFAEHGATFARRAGVIAAIGLALSPFFNLFVRYGTEHALLPVMELVAVAFLWQGVRRGGWREFAVAGGVVGLSQYAYIVARAFPVALATAAALIALVHPRPLRQRWRGWTVAGLAFALVALPQWMLFASEPFTFLARTEQSAGRFVFGLPDPLAVMAAKLASQMLMLGVHWDTPYNPFSGRPLLNPALLVGLIAALGAALRGGPARRFVVVVAGLMLVPELITYEDLSPSATRVIGAVPFIFMLAGAGGAGIWAWLAGRPRLPPWAGRGVLLAVALAGAEAQWDLASRVLPKVYAMDGLEWRVSLVELAEAEYIREHEGAAILIASSEYQRSPLAFLLAGQFPERSGGRPPLAPGDPAIVIATADPERPTTEGIPAGYVPDEWVLLVDGTAYFLPPSPGSVAVTGDPQPVLAANGALAATAFAARWLGATTAATPVGISFGDGLDLVGYQATPLEPGRPVIVTLYWRPRHRVSADEQVFVQILDRGGNAVAAVHAWPLHGAYRVRAWRPGEVVPLTYSLDLPGDAAPGPYRLTAGVFDLIRQQRVTVEGGGDVAAVATLKVPLPAPSAAPARRLGARFGEAIVLRGDTLAAGAEGLRLSLFWEAAGRPDADYSVFVHVVDASGNLVAQSDGQPLDGQYPTSIWDRGETVVDERLIPLGAGEYQVYVGLYRWDTLERLPAVVDGQRLPDDRLSLGVVQVP